MGTSRMGGEGVSLSLPAGRPTPVRVGAFLACPVPGTQASAPVLMGMQTIYQLAYEQARAALAPSWYEQHRNPVLN